MSKLLYADKVWRRTIIYLISRGVPEYKYAKILSNTTLIMLERTMYLATILLLVKYRIQKHWFDGKHYAKVRTKLTDSKSI